MFAKAQEFFVVKNFKKLRLIFSFVLVASFLIAGVLLLENKVALNSPSAMIASQNEVPEESVDTRLTPKIDPSMPSNTYTAIARSAEPSAIDQQHLNNNEQPESGTPIKFSNQQLNSLKVGDIFEIDEAGVGPFIVESALDRPNGWRLTTVRPLDESFKFSSVITTSATAATGILYTASGSYEMEVLNGLGFVRSDAQQLPFNDKVLYPPESRKETAN